MRTALTQLLQIEYPIIQGAMAWVSEHKLVAAVANYRCNCPWWPRCRVDSQ